MTSTVRAGLVGAGLGGATVFLLDPDRGARRRALVRDKAVWAAHKTRDAAGATGRDLGNRLSGVRARVRSRFSDQTADDATLCRRVRAILGRATSHPRAICVDARDGIVTLTGDALAPDAASMVSAVSAVRGVKEVRNDVTRHASADGIPSLQGSTERPGQWMTWARGAATALLTAGICISAGAVAIAAAAARASNGRTPSARASDEITFADAEGLDDEGADLPDAVVFVEEDFFQ